MVKIFASIIIFLSCSITGFIYGEGLRKRVKALNEIESALYNLENQIMFTYTPLPEAFKHLAIKCSGSEKKFFQDISDLLVSNKVENVYQAFAAALEDNRTLLNIKKEDESILLDLAKTLGESDLEGQKSMFLLAYKNINKEISFAELSLSKNVKMYRGLGISAGAAIVILLF